MKTNANTYPGYRFPREIISHGVWLYHRFSLSFRDVEELLAKRGILVQRYRNARSAKRFFRRLLKGQGSTPWKLVTAKLKSYSAAHRNVMPSVAHDTRRYENNRAEVSHQPTRRRERQIQRFKSPGQAQRFLSVHGVIQNFFRIGRHHLRSENYRLLRSRSFKEGSAATAA